MRDLHSGELAVESTEATVCRRILLEEILGKLSDQERALVLRLAEDGVCNPESDAVLVQMRERLKKQGYSLESCF